MITVSNAFLRSRHTPITISLFLEEHLLSQKTSAKIMYHTLWQKAEEKDMTVENNKIGEWERMGDLYIDT